MLELEGAAKHVPSSLTEDLLMLPRDGVSLHLWLPGPHTEPHTPFLPNPPSPRGFPSNPSKLGDQITTAGSLSANSISADLGGYRK